jgi:hypothetical protein
LSRGRCLADDQVFGSDGLFMCPSSRRKCRVRDAESHTEHLISLCARTTLQRRVLEHNSEVE